MSVFISEEDQAAMAKSFAKRQQAAEEGGYAGFVSAEQRREFEERTRNDDASRYWMFGERPSPASQAGPQMYAPVGAHNVYPNQPNLEDGATVRHISPWLNVPSSAAPLVDQYLPTFAFTAEERKQVEELLRKGLRG